MAVDWNAINAMVQAGYKANADGTITTPTGQVVAGSSPVPAAPAPAASTGVNWGAIQSMVDAGYKNNPDGTITKPDGTTVRSDGNGGWITVPRPKTAEEMAAEQRARESQERAAQTAAQTSASVRSILRQYGLEELLPEVDGWVRSGLTWPEIEAMLRDPSTTAGKKLDEIYPEIRLRSEKKLQPMSVEQIQTYRTRAKQLFRSAGLPVGFYDENSDLTGLIVGDVSWDELNERVQNGFTEVASAPAEVRDAFREFFGAHGDAALASYFLDKDKALPTLEKAVQAAKVGGAAKMFGYGVDANRAGQIAETGADFASARTAFGNIRGMDSLFTETISEGVDFTAEGEGVDAAFGLGGGTAGKKLADRLETRTAAFQGAGGAAAGERGVYGLGAAKK